MAPISPSERAEEARVQSQMRGAGVDAASGLGLSEEKEGFGRVGGEGLRAGGLGRAFLGAVGSNHGLAALGDGR